MTYQIFEDRAEAGRRLAQRLKREPLRNPVVLAIPRGGIEVGAPISRALGAELDVVLSRKIPAPYQPELALGAVSETGEVYLNHHSRAVAEAGQEYIEQERVRQLSEIERRKTMFRAVRPKATLRGRSVIVVDDGIATGSTMAAALRTARAAGPAELVVAVPVAAPDRLAEIAGLCDRVICLLETEEFWSVGQFYRRFNQTSDERVVELLREFGQPVSQPATRPAPSGGVA